MHEGSIVVLMWLSWKCACLAIPGYTQVPLNTFLLMAELPDRIEKKHT